jgi:hypothetical protein
VRSWAGVAEMAIVGLYALGVPLWVAVAVALFVGVL